MKLPTKLLLVFALVAISTQFLAIAPASAITAELANKCREISLKAFPRQRVGTKGGNSGEIRKYYNGCIANGGSPLDDNAKKPATAPAR